MKKALTQKEVRDQLTTPYCNDLGDHQNDREHVPIVPFICKCRTIVHRQRKWGWNNPTIKENDTETGERNGLASINQEPRESRIDSSLSRLTNLVCIHKYASPPSSRNPLHQNRRVCVQIAGPQRRTMFWSRGHPSTDLADGNSFYRNFVRNQRAIYTIPANFSQFWFKSVHPFRVDFLENFQ